MQIKNLKHCQICPFPSYQSFDKSQVNSVSRPVAATTATTTAAAIATTAALEISKDEEGNDSVTKVNETESLKLI
jgi:hypothetical protein